MAEKTDMAASNSLLIDYYTARDGADPVSALELLASDVQYHLMPAPGLEISGRGRDELRSVLSGIKGKPGKHRVVAAATSNGVEFVLGHRVQDGMPVGSFIAVATASADGALSTYLGAYFDGTLGLADD